MKHPLTLAMIGAAAILFTGSTIALAAPGDRGGRLERMMTHLDTDQSGAISYEEFAKRGDDRFAQMDADGDGFITADERQAAKAGAKDRAAEAGEGKRGRKGRKGDMKRRAEARLERVDTDQDGVISLAEHNAAQQAQFAELDSDSSGSVTADEFEAQMKDRRARMKERRGE